MPGKNLPLSHSLSPYFEPFLLSCAILYSHHKGFNFFTFMPVFVIVRNKEKEIKLCRRGQASVEQTREGQRVRARAMPLFWAEGLLWFAGGNRCCLGTGLCSALWSVITGLWCLCVFSPQLRHSLFNSLKSLGLGLADLPSRQQFSNSIGY